MPHAGEVQSLLATHTARVDNPHSTTGAQLGLGVLQSSSGQINGVASGVDQVIFAAPGTTNAVYLVAADIVSGSPADYSAVSIVTTDNGVARVTALQTATTMSISISGLNIRARQASGVAQNILWTVTRLS